MKIFFPNILHSKVVNNEGKLDVSGFVCPHGRCAGARVIIILRKVCFDSTILNATSLFEASHFLLSFYVVMSIVVGSLVEVVMLDMASSKISLILNFVYPNSFTGFHRRSFFMPSNSQWVLGVLTMILMRVLVLVLG